MGRNVIRFTGADDYLAISDRFTAMALRARDVSPAWRLWGDDVVVAFTEQFVTEGARLLERVWDPLSPRYAAWKERHFPGQTILRRTDAMMHGFTGRPMAVERIEPHSCAFGSNRKPAIWHQKGTRRMPARPIARATSGLKRSASRHIKRHIVRGDL